MDIDKNMSSSTTVDSLKQQVELKYGDVVAKHEALEVTYRTYKRFREERRDNNNNNNIQHPPPPPDLDRVRQLASLHGQIFRQCGDVVRALGEFAVLLDQAREAMNSDEFSRLKAEVQDQAASIADSLGNLKI